jgi:hypothetical protein
MQRAQALTAPSSADQFFRAAGGDSSPTPYGPNTGVLPFDAHLLSQPLPSPSPLLPSPSPLLPSTLPEPTSAALPAPAAPHPAALSTEHHSDPPSNSNAPTFRIEVATGSQRGGFTQGRGSRGRGSFRGNNSNYTQSRAYNRDNSRHDNRDNSRHDNRDNRHGSSSSRKSGQDSYRKDRK